jgi:hypothetical protein
MEKWNSWSELQTGFIGSAISRLGHHPVQTASAGGSTFAYSWGRPNFDSNPDSSLSGGGPDWALAPTTRPARIHRRA